MFDTCRIFWTTVTIPTYVRQPNRKLPELFMGGAGNYPDTQDDILDGPRRDVAYQAIILENRHLKLTLIPDLGGKLWSVHDKHTGDDVIYAPDVVKPSLVGRAGAWIPGGMEFNFPVGHHIRTMRHLPCAIVEDTPRAVAAVVQRACDRTHMRMDARIGLAADEARFTIDYTVTNPTALRHRWYQWTNVGVLYAPRWQFQCKAQWHTTGSTVHPYPVEDGRDSSWVVNRDWPSDSFMAGCRDDWFGYYDHDRHLGICHVADWRDVAGKKYYTWGTKHKVCNDRMVFSDAGHSYLEIQAGPFETQREFQILAPGRGHRWHTTWFPYRGTGGIDWADDRLVFNARAGRPRLYPAADQEITVTVNGHGAARRLRAGVPATLPIHVCTGDLVTIARGGERIAAFTFPYPGRQEPNAIRRLRRQYRVPRLVKPRTAAQWLERGRKGMLLETYTFAVDSYRKALQLKPGLHRARLELGDALWHTGAFDDGARQFRRLLRSPLAKQARAYLDARPRVEHAFLGPLLEMAARPQRDQALAEKYAGLGNHAAAVRLFTRLLKADPRNWRAHYAMARYYHYAKYKPRLARRHAERALALNPGDRDLIIELVPLIRQTGAVRRARDLVLAAPPAVRRLNMLRKLLAGLHFELGDADKSLAITARERLFNREGEVGHIDLYQDAAAVKAEDALRSGDLATALTWAGRVRAFPAGLGVLKRYLGNARPALWTGLAAWRAGDRDGARSIWRTGAADCLHEIADFSQMVNGVGWIYLFTEELAWSLGICAILSGDAALRRAALTKVDSLAKSLF